MEKENKRLFFGWEAISPWQEDMPEGRYVTEKHMTIAFIGNTNRHVDLEGILQAMPHPYFKIAPGGFFDKTIFLPLNFARAVAYHVSLFGKNKMEEFYSSINAFLIEKKFILKKPHVKHKLLPHVTVARKPFDISKWKKAFIPMPVYFKNFYLYESIGNLQYNKSTWRYSLPAPFEEIEHTADLSFKIIGTNFYEIYCNSLLALFFNDIRLIPYADINAKTSSLEDIVQSLNAMIRKMDTDIGSQYKGVCYSGHMLFNEDTKLYNWEMIVDV
jgi:RNA 2',3'-cyclic 3'-phosphodiesterase